MSSARRPQNWYQERVNASFTAVAAVAASTTVPLRTMPRDFILDQFEVEAAGGYTADPAAYYDISVQQKPVSFTATAATDICAVTAHGYQTGNAVQVSNSGGGLPAGLAAVTTYFVIVVDANSFKLATTAANAIAGTAIDITTAGTGTQFVAKVYAMYSLKTVTGNGSLTDLVLANGSILSDGAGPAGTQLNLVLTKFSTAANIGALSRFVAHLRLL